MNLTVNGAAAYAYTGGKPFDAAKPTLVFVHGTAMDHSVWALQSRYLAHHGYGVLALDLPAHGRSAGAPLARIEAMADWVAALLHAAQVRQATVIGHSMGSLVALDCVRRHGANFSRAVLVGCSVPMPVAEPFLGAAHDDLASAVMMETLWGHSYQGYLGPYQVPGMWQGGMTQRLIERNARASQHADLVACNAYAPDPASLASISQPILVISGTRDVMTPMKAGVALAKSLPNARSHVIEGAGHALMSEAPDAVLDALIPFLKR